MVGVFRDHATIGHTQLSGLSSLTIKRIGFEGNFGAAEDSHLVFREPLRAVVGLLVWLRRLSYTGAWTATQTYISLLKNVKALTTV